MKYLLEHYDTFYYRRKLHYQNFCISLKTKNKLEAKYILSIINSKIEVLREHMNFEEELEYIKEIIKHYVDVAKEEYSLFASKREKKYTYTKENGKRLSGSHPLSIEKAIENLTDDLYADEDERNSISNTIIEDSNIKEEFTKALQTLSRDNQQRLKDEIIKAEIELLYYDKSRNESRVKEDKFENTYIPTTKKRTNAITYSNAKEMIKMIDEEEKDKYRMKDKDELFAEYFAIVQEEKKNEHDKINLSIRTLLQSSDEKYLIDYSMEAFERFFIALIYSPSKITLKKSLYNSYNQNIVLLAEDYKEAIDNGQEEEFCPDYELKLQSASNVSEKLKHITNFLNFCVSNGFLEKNVLANNVKFSDIRYKKILKIAKDRKPFNTHELNQMCSMLASEIEVFGFSAEQFYIPLIALYSGMRVEEICKLKTKDIIFDDEVYCFDVNGQVKTKNSTRLIPIHKDLIERFKFLEYQETRQGKEQLFTLSTINIKGKIKHSHYFLRDFTTFRNNFVSEERIENDLVSFHSFRHTFATRLRQASVAYSDIAQLLGHKIETVIEQFENVEIKNTRAITERYVHEDKTPTQHLQDKVNALNLEDLQTTIDDLEKVFKKTVKY